MLAESKRQYTGYVICVLYFGLMIWAFYPGLMSSDSIANLTYGRMGTFPDINSPVMSYLWGQADKLIAGPGLMFLLQNIIFWCACIIFWQTAKRKSFWLGLCFILFALLPQIFSQLTTVWKDVGLGVTLFLASALLYQANASKNKLALLISPVFLFYGYAVRLNSIAAVLPLAIWSGFIAGRVFQLEKRKFLPVLIGLSYFAILSITVYLVNHRLTEGKTVYPFQQVLLYDLAAISIAQNEPHFPDYIVNHENFSMDAVKERYNIRSVNSLIYDDAPNQENLPILQLTFKPEEISALRQKWFETVSENPTIYLAHRWRIFAQLIGFTRNTVSNPYWDPGFSTSPPEYRREDNLANKVLMKYFHLARKPGFFHGFLGVLFCLFFLYQAIKNRMRDDWEIIAVLSTSCLLFTFAYFPTTPSTEFRYIFWTAISSSLVTILGTYLLLTKENSRLFNRFFSRVKK